MNFELSEEQRLFADSLERFLQENADTADTSCDPSAEADFWQKLCDLGVLGALFIEGDGGFGSGAFDVALVFEALGRAGVDAPVLDVAILAGGLISRLGSPAQKALIAELIGGQCRIAFAHEEEDSRYDPLLVSLTPDRTNDGLSVTGRKSLVVAADASDWLILSLCEGDDRGLSLFLLSTDTPGIEIQNYPLISGGMANEVRMSGVSLLESSRLGPKGCAAAAIEAATAKAIVAQCAQTVGAMEQAIDMTREYLTTRKQFGKPLASFQVLAHRFADLLIDMEQARSAMINAAGHLEADPVTRDRHMSAAKNLIGRVGRQVAEECIQMHGGIAMTQEYALARFAKKIVMADHRFGDTDFHLERFIELSSLRQPDP